MSKYSNYSVKRNKQIDSVFKRHFQTHTDAESVLTDWPQAMAHFSLKQHSKKLKGRRTFDTYKDYRYSIDLWKALKVWEGQMKMD